MEEEGQVSYSELVARVKQLEKKLMEKEIVTKISTEGTPIEFSPRSIITKSHRDMLNDIKKIEKIIAAVQYDMDLMSTLQQEEAQQQAQETAPQEPVPEGQEVQEQTEAQEETPKTEEERDNNKIVKKKKRDRKSRESDE
ncbi:hypothetical protein HY570_01315 [Candidatus Micrarchaeota archaeon]|nr:hypothetical protein [Candidatus Micrarchaeota archaeon]